MSKEEEKVLNVPLKPEVRKLLDARAGRQRPRLESRGRVHHRARRGRGQAPGMTMEPECPPSVRQRRADFKENNR